MTKNLLSLQVKQRPVIDEECYHGSHGLKELVETNQQASDTPRGVFGHIRWGKHGCTTKTKAFHESTAVSHNS